MCKCVNYIGWVLLLILVACRGPEIYVEPEREQKGDTTKTAVVGFYLLNEGNMGSNKASLDYYDYTTATYTRNIYQEANPDVTQSLGDVGNDLVIYGSRLYAVINCSNLVEVMDARTAKHIGTIACPNCRYLCFKDGYGYLTSYAGPVEIGTAHAQIGFVAKFDTASLEIVDKCLVGYQPDELDIVDNRLYVANSGGYMVPNYEDEVSVIDLDSFKEIDRIKVARNLHRIKADHHGMLWVSSRGDYYEQPSRLYCVDPKQGKVVDSVCIAVSEMWLDGDSLYTYGSEFSYITYETAINYAIIDVRTHSMVTDNFITDGTDVEITVPYGIMVQPKTKEIYVTDAKNYVSPGRVHCYGSDGKRKWTVRTGDIPAHMAFLFVNIK